MNYRKENESEEDVNMKDLCQESGDSSSSDYIAKELCIFSRKVVKLQYDFLVPAIQNESLKAM